MTWLFLFKLIRFHRLQLYLRWQMTGSISTLSIPEWNKPFNCTQIVPPSFFLSSRFLPYESQPASQPASRSCHCATRIRICKLTLCWVSVPQFWWDSRLNRHSCAWRFPPPPPSVLPITHSVTGSCCCWAPIWYYGDLQCNCKSLSHVLQLQVSIWCKCRAWGRNKWMHNWIFRQEDRPRAMSLSSGVTTTKGLASHLFILQITGLWVAVVGVRLESTVCKVQR